MIAWTVTIGHKYLTTVYFSSSMDSEYIRNSLINLDGFDPAISIQKQ